ARAFFLEGRTRGFAIRIRAKTLDQAAGLNSLVALALMGSTVSVATRWVNSASSLVLAVKVSNCLRAWEVHSSIVGLPPPHDHVAIFGLIFDAPRLTAGLLGGDQHAATAGKRIKHNCAPLGDVPDRIRQHGDGLHRRMDFITIGAREHSYRGMRHL